ncbi:hypothetical protein BH10PSE2_BH10PSE2_20550 [soil metagenome]
MFKTLIPAVVALGLVAFTAKTQDIRAEDVGGQSVGGQSVGGQAASTQAKSAQIQSITVAPVMAWHLSQEGDMAKLAYGIADSDQLAMMVTCAPGDRTAVIYGDIQPVSPDLVAAASEESGEGEASEMHLPLRDAALRSLADNGRMVVRGEAGTFGLTATRQEQQAIGQFLGYCGSARA